MEIPNGMYARITDRSSLTIKGITVRGGVIDSDYCGNIVICLHNSTDKEITFTAGTRIGQIIFEKHGTPFIMAVDHLSETTRQKGGFGSTNKPTLGKGQRTHTHRIDDSRIIIATDSFQKTRAKVVTIPIVKPDNDNNSNDTTARDQSNDNENNNTVTIQPIDQTENLQNHTNHSQSTTDCMDQTVHKIPPDPPSPVTDSHHKLPTNTPMDRVNLALPKVVILTHDCIRMATGYTKAESLIKHMKTTGTKSVHVSNLTNDIKLDEGSTASMRSVNRTTTPVQHKIKYGDEWHMDISFGPCTAIGAITHCLVLIDRATRTHCTYLLKNLTDLLLSKVKKFISQAGKVPKTIYTDFDPKLMAGNVRIYLEEEKGIEVKVAPPSNSTKMDSSKEIGKP